MNPQWVDYLYCVNENWRVEEIRQHILEKFSKNLHLVLDDDLTLYKKLEKRRWEKIKDSIAFLKHIRELLETYKHGSIASHASHHFHDPSLRLNERAGGVHFYHRNVLLKNKINYSVCLEHEDLHVSLSLIKNGILTLFRITMSLHSKPMPREGAANIVRCRHRIDTPKR